MDRSTQKDTPSWILFVWCSFLLAPAITLTGIYHAPVDLWVKAFLAMGLLWSVGASLTLAKTLRDNFEAQRPMPRPPELPAERVRADYELRKS